GGQSFHISGELYADYRYAGREVVFCAIFYGYYGILGQYKHDRDMEIRTQEDFQRLLETDFGEGRYGYGSAWDSAYVYNELSEFINFFGGSYYDWNSPSTREALTFLADMVKKAQTPIEQITDQYEQLEQKFLEGTYASIFVYSGTLDMFVRAGAYREDFIQLAPLPRFKENVTNIAAWQYVLNKSSANKEAAIRFLKY